MKAERATRGTADPAARRVEGPQRSPAPDGETRPAGKRKPRQATPRPGPLRFLLSLSDRWRGMALLSGAVPLLVLAGFGAYSVLRQGYWLPFLAALALTTGVLLVPAAWRRLRPKRVSPPTPALESTAFEKLDREAPPHWNDTDRQVLAEVKPELLPMIQQNAGWEGLPRLGLAVMRRTAECYHQGKRDAEWSFSPIELLAVAEHASRRYRQILKDNIPFIENIKVRHLLWLHRHGEYAEYANKAYQVYRKARIVTPEGLIAELRSLMTDPWFDKLTDDVQRKVKFLLLQETLHIAIDLYGGHFRFDEADLDLSHAGRRDQDRVAEPLEPVRIALLGQVSAGKSSIVNLLIHQTQAEVSALPSTDGVTVYPFDVDGEPLFNLVDLPGLNGDSATEKLLLQQIVQSDVVLWVLKASQPARKLDQQFKARLDQWFAADNHAARRPPLVIGVLNQVDRLGNPGDWHPPYDLSDNSNSGSDRDDAKAALIREALAYNQEVLQLDVLLPLSIAPGKPHFNVAALVAAVHEAYDDALQVQLNRRRQEAGEVSLQSLKKQTLRLRKLAGNAFGLLRPQKPRPDGAAQTQPSAAPSEPSNRTDDI